jgi:hypothetical protein
VSVHRRQEQKVFSPPEALRLAEGPTQTPIQWVRWELSLGFWPGRKTLNYLNLMQRRTQKHFWGAGGSLTNSVEDRGQRERGSGDGSPLSQWFHSICKWVKPVFWLGCYGYIFHGTGNSAQLCQNFWISGEVWTPQPPPPLVHHLSNAKLQQLDKIPFQYTYS